MNARTFILVSALAVFGAGLPACESLMSKPTKTAAGELYESGDGKYDSYFKKVHEEQVAAGSWADESKAARKPITTALNLPPTASNSTIVSSAKSKKGEGAVHGAAEETASAELAFAKKQSANAERLDKLAAEGAELKKQAVEERRNMAADKADPEKVDKKEELKREIGAAVDVAAGLRDDAKKGAKEAEDLAKSLQKELGVVGDMPPKKEEPAPPKKDEGGAHAGKKPESKPAAKKPASKPAAAPPAGEDKPAEKPVPKAAPTQKPADEVFNP